MFILQTFNFRKSYLLIFFIFNKIINPANSNIMAAEKPILWLAVKKVKEMGSKDNLPVFPEDYAYYLLNDNETLIMISGVKSIRSNFKFNLKSNKLEKLPMDNSYKLYISSLLKNCGYKNISDTYNCSYYKPLISENLIN